MRALQAVLTKLLLVGVFIFLTACVHPPPQKLQSTVLLSNIITMDPAYPQASAVAIHAGKIAAVGSLAEIQRTLAEHQLTIDKRFLRQTLLPGFIDNHLHPTLAGILLPSKFITPFDWHLPGQKVIGVHGKEAYLKRLTELVAEHQDEQKIFITWGYHQYFHGDLSRAELDTISATKPIIVWQRSFHELYANTAALAALQIDQQDYPNHPAINFAQGHFWELGLFAIFPKLAPLILAPQRMQEGMQSALLHAQQNGITTLADQGSPMLDLQMELGNLNTVFAEHQIPIRMLLIGNGKTLANEGFEQALDTLESLPARNTEYVSFLPKQVKILADGAFYSQLMQMEDGYLDGHHGEWIMPPDELEKAARTYWQAGYQLHIHVNGDKGLNVVLDIIQRLNSQLPRDHKTVLHHYGYAAENHAERIAALGISVSANPYYLWALGDKYAEIGLGRSRAHYITRLGDLERNSVPISFHSDLPMAPAAPLMLASIAASRISAAGNLLAATERVSINTALRAITIDAAAAIQQDNRIGSITVGKQADFTILQQNPLHVAAEQLGEIEVWGTIVNGKIFEKPIYVE